MSQKTAANKYKNEVSNKNPWNDPTNSIKKPASTVPIMAANVPAVLDIPEVTFELVVNAELNFHILQKFSCLLVLLLSSKNNYICQES